MYLSGMQSTPVESKSASVVPKLIILGIVHQHLIQELSLLVHEAARQELQAPPSHLPSIVIRCIDRYHLPKESTQVIQPANS